MDKNIAADILYLNELWKQTNKQIIASNVEEYLYSKYPECRKSYKLKMEKLQEISGSQKNTVYAWVNRSREDVKVPFLKLCRIATALNVDIKKMFIQRPSEDLE